MRLEKQNRRLREVTMDALATAGIDIGHAGTLEKILGVGLCAGG